MKKIIYTVKKLIDPRWWVWSLKNVVLFLPRLGNIVLSFGGFFLILVFYMSEKIFLFLSRLPLIGIPLRIAHPIFHKLFEPVFYRLFGKLERFRKFKIKRRYLVYLAFENLKARRGRSMITILGMSVGVAIIVYLVSLGYGIEKLIIGQVASLDELRIVDVSAGESTALRLGRETIRKIKKIAGVESIVPIVSVVGRMNYQKAETDVLVYAVPDEYMRISRVNLIHGKQLSGNKLSKYYDLEDQGSVAGAEDVIQTGEYGKPENVTTSNVNINPQELAPVWESCDIHSNLLGYTVRIEGGTYRGAVYWGGEYAPFNQHGRVGYDKKRDIYLGKWVKSTVPLFSQSELDKSVSPQLDDKGIQMRTEGCIQQKYVQIIDSYQFSEVLGESTTASDEGFVELASVLSESTVAEATDSAETESSTAYNADVVASDSAGIELVKLQASSAAQLKQVKELEFKQTPSGQALISSGLMNLLGLNSKNVINTKFSVSFNIMRSLMPEAGGKVLSAATEYKVVGVIDDAERQFFYIPFADMEKLSVENFSQLKVLLTNKNEMPKVRKQIEVLGFNTTSANDTVSQIESFFANLRLILGLLGLIALAVASLGMFNTMTVSLLERTREIGGMKTMGMVSSEIQDLFLAEGMIMGFGGGIGGILLGYFAGEITSFIISIFAVIQGGGYMRLTYVPPFFVFFIVISSFIVGILTGLYPSLRAKRTSALNALRYE